MVGADRHNEFAGITTSKYKSSKKSRLSSFSVTGERPVIRLRRLKLRRVISKQSYSEKTEYQKVEYFD